MPDHILKLYAVMVKGGSGENGVLDPLPSNSYLDPMNLSTKQLKQALHIREQIDSLESKLSEILGNKISGSGTKIKRGMSVAGRKRVALAQKLRWAKLKGGKTEAPVKKRRKVSAAVKRKMAEAAKKRWALAKAAGKNRL